MLRIAGAITLGCSFLRSFAAAHSCMDLSPKKSFLAGSRLGQGVLEISVQPDSGPGRGPRAGRS